MDTSAPCRFLDRNTRLCTVYARRFSVCQDCKKLTLLHAMFSPYLPESCGYVQKYRLSLVLRRAVESLLRRLVRTEGIAAKILRK